MAKKKGKNSWKSTRDQSDVLGSKSGGFDKNGPVEKFGNKGVKK
jgi:hypothetical protein